MARGTSIIDRPRFIARHEDTAPEGAVSWCVWGARNKPPTAHDQKSKIKNQKSRPAFTLAESMIAVVILALSVTAIASVLSASRQYGAVTDDVVTSQELARQLMEEITAKPFADPDGRSSLGPEAGETTRLLFDNVDDYNGYADTQLRDSGRKKFDRNVTVEYRATRNGAAAATGDFVVVNVTVKGPDGRQVVLSQLLTCSGTRRS